MGEEELNSSAQGNATMADAFDGWHCPGPWDGPGYPPWAIYAWAQG
jgi:hypothetical protein